MPNKIAFRFSGKVKDLRKALSVYLNQLSYEEYLKGSFLQDPRD